MIERIQIQNYKSIQNADIKLGNLNVLIGSNLIDFANTNVFFFKLKPAIGNKAFIETSGDFFNNEDDKTKDYEKLWNRTLRFIALTTLLLQPNLPDTIIIDEPELGLHPTAINKFAALLRRAAQKKQIILATQSVNLVNCFEPEDIIVVDRESKQTVFNRLEKDTLDAWLEEYNIDDIWENNR